LCNLNIIMKSNNQNIIRIRRHARMLQCRVTTLRTLWNSLTFPWQCAALMPMLSGTHSITSVISSCKYGAMDALLWNAVRNPSSNCAMETQLASFALVNGSDIASFMVSTLVSYGSKYSSSTEQFWDTFPWQDFFPDISLTVNSIPDISLTCFKFHDISRFSRQVVTLTMSMDTLEAQPTSTRATMQHVLTRRHTVYPFSNS